MSSELLQQLLESKLEYLKYSITPNESGLDLIDKDSASGNLDRTQMVVLLRYYDSLHRLQQFKEYREVFIDSETGEELKDPKIIQVFSFPTTINNLRSKIKSLLVSSGSYLGFKSLLQHTSIQKGEQVQTLKDETEKQKKKIWGGRKR